MRKILLPLTAAALIASSAAVFAANTTTEGTIKAFDMTAMTLTLEDGTVYTLPAGFKDPGLKVGEKVSVVWKMVNDKHEAETVTISK